MYQPGVFVKIKSYQQVVKVEWFVLRSPQARDYIWSYKDHGKDFQLFNTPNAGLGFRWLHSSFWHQYAPY